jgi:hypothetical protein
VIQRLPDSVGMLPITQAAAADISAQYPLAPPARSRALAWVYL